LLSNGYSRQKTLYLKRQPLRDLRFVVENRSGSETALASKLTGFWADDYSFQRDESNENDR